MQCHARRTPCAAELHTGHVRGGPVVTSKGGAASPEPAKAPTVSCSGAKCVPCQLAQSTRHVVPRGSAFPRSGSEMPRLRISSASSHSRRTGAGIEGQTARQASGEETGRERCQQQRCLCRRVSIIALATVVLGAQASVAEPAADECKTTPGSSAPPGQHWYYRVNRSDQRHCWYLGAESTKVRAQTREKASSSPAQPAREEASETTRTMPPPPMEIITNAVRPDGV